MATRVVNALLGDMIERMVKAEHNRRMGGLGGDDGESEEREIALVKDALNLTHITIPLECDPGSTDLIREVTQSGGDADAIFDIICDTSCCRVTPKKVPVRPPVPKVVAKVARGAVVRRGLLS